MRDRIDLYLCLIVQERLRLLLDMAREEANMAIIDRDKARALSDQLEPRVRKLEADLKQVGELFYDLLTEFCDEIYFYIGFLINVYRCDLAV